MKCILICNLYNYSKWLTNISIQSSYNQINKHIITYTYTRMYLYTTTYIMNINVGMPIGMYTGIHCHSYTHVLAAQTDVYIHAHTSHIHDTLSYYNKYLRLQISR